MHQDRARRLFSYIKEHPIGPVTNPAVQSEVEEWVSQAVANESTRFQKHPFGFLKAVLGECDCQGALALFRLHVWHPTIRYFQSPQPLCHTHAWRLASYVLRGPLTNKNYRMLSGADDAQFKLFHVFVADGTTTIARPAEENVGAETISIDRLDNHSVYHVDRGTFHTSSVEDNAFVITLAILHDRERVPVMNLRGRDECEDAPFDQAFLDPQDANRVRREILDYLSATSAPV
jgi:hypothetical protein